MPRFNFVPYLYSSFWLLFAVAWFFRDSRYRYFYSLTGTAAALVLFCLSFLIGRGKLWAWRGMVALVVLGILVSALDEVGWADIVFLLFSSAVLAFLPKSRPGRRPQIPLIS